LFVEFDQDRDFDRAAGGESELIVEKNLFACRQVLDRHAHHAVEAIGDLFDFGGEFAAQQDAVVILRAGR